MRERAKQLAVLGLDRALSAARLEDTDRLAARADTVDWARVRMRAIRERREVVGGVRVVVTRPGRAEVRPLEVTVAGPGEVTVELLASAVSVGTERAQWLRLPNAQPVLPFTPGYSGAGRVLAVGEGVEGLERGRVVAVAQAPHASVVTVPASRVTNVPAGVRIEEAALVYLAIIAGYGVRRAGGVAGESVCILGAGPIGALAHRLLMLEGPGTVTVVAASRRREAAALRAGAARFMTVEESTHDLTATTVIEATGDPDAIPVAVSAARPGGTVVLLGSPRGVTRLAPVAEIQAKGLRLVGAHVSALAMEARRQGREPFAELSSGFVEALAVGRLDVADLVGEAVDPREAGLLYRRLVSGETGAAHLDWSGVPRGERVRRRRVLSLPAWGEGSGPIAAAPPEPVSDRGARLRFAAIGCGDIGFANARAIAGAANADLVLCHDAHAALAAAAAERFGGEVALSLDEALDADRVDAVFLSVPHHLHSPLAVRAAQAGLHVVVEKPLAVGLAAGEAAVAAAAAAGVALSVCFSFRYHPVVQTARMLVRGGAIGRLRGATVLFHADKPPSYWVGGFSGRAASGWRARREQAGGGVLIMNLTHYVDLLRYVARAEPAWVAGAARTDDGAEVEDAVSLSVVFSDGAVGSLSASASTRGSPATRFELWGDAGTLRLEPEPAIFTERALGGVVPGRWLPLADDSSDEEMRRVFVERFAENVLAGRAPDVETGDGLAVQAFLDAAYRAIEEGRPVSLAARERATA